MKSGLKIASILFFIAIYSFAISIVTQSSGFSDVQKKTQSEQHYLSDLSLQLFCPSSQSESSLSNLTNASNQSLKNSLDFACFNATESEVFIQSLFRHYAALSNTIEISLSIATIIFPFHYFW